MTKPDSFIYNEFSIGQTLAFINANIDISESPDHSEEFKVYFQTIKSLYNNMKSENNSGNHLDQIPKYNCNSFDPFLLKYPYLLIHFIRSNEAGNADPEFNSRFIKHLNNCYWCFDIYNRFLQDYYRTKNNLKNKGVI